MIVPSLVTLTHFIWVIGWWGFGHSVYLLAKGCTARTCSFTDFSSEDWFGGLLAIGASFIYIYIGHKVINALYKGELPDGSPVGNIEKLLRNVSTQMNGGNRKARRAK